jgi:hypothetical protein
MGVDLSRLRSKRRRSPRVRHRVVCRQVLGISLLGPYYLSPFDKHNRAYTLLEATPLAVGEAYSRNVTFSGYGCEVCFKLKHETVPVGGWIEPIGVDMGGPDDSKVYAPQPPTRRPRYKLAPTRNAHHALRSLCTPPRQPLLTLLRPL